MLYMLYGQGEMWPVKGIKKSGSCCCWSTTQMRVPSEVIPIEAVAALATETAAATTGSSSRQAAAAGGNKATAKAGSRQAATAKKFKVWVIKNVAAAQ